MVAKLGQKDIEPRIDANEHELLWCFFVPIGVDYRRSSRSHGRSANHVIQIVHEHASGGFLRATLCS
jgi:hypothetical protein